MTRNLSARQSVTPRTNSSFSRYLQQIDVSTRPYSAKNIESTKRLALLSPQKTNDIVKLYKKLPDSHQTITEQAFRRYQLVSVKKMSKLKKNHTKEFKNLLTEKLERRVVLDSYLDGSVNEKKKSQLINEECERDNKLYYETTSEIRSERKDLFFLSKLKIDRHIFEEEARILKRQLAWSRSNSKNEVEDKRQLTSNITSSLDDEIDEIAKEINQLREELKQARTSMKEHLETGNKDSEDELENDAHPDRSSENKYVGGIEEKMSELRKCKNSLIKAQSRIDEMNDVVTQVIEKKFQNIASLHDQWLQNINELIEVEKSSGLEEDKSKNTNTYTEVSRIQKQLTITKYKFQEKANFLRSMKELSETLSKSNDTISDEFNRIISALEDELNTAKALLIEALKKYLEVIEPKRHPQEENVWKIKLHDSIQEQKTIYESKKSDIVKWLRNENEKMNENAENLKEKRVKTVKSIMKNRLEEASAAEVKMLKQLYHSTSNDQCDEECLEIKNDLVESDDRQMLFAFELLKGFFEKFGYNTLLSYTNSNLSLAGAAPYLSEKIRKISVVSIILCKEGSITECTNLSSSEKKLLSNESGLSQYFMNILEKQVIVCKMKPEESVLLISEYSISDEINLQKKLPHCQIISTKKLHPTIYITTNDFDPLSNVNFEGESKDVSMNGIPYNTPSSPWVSHAFRTQKLSEGMTVGYCLGDEIMFANAVDTNTSNMLRGEPCERGAVFANNLSLARCANFRVSNTTYLASIEVRIPSTHLQIPSSPSGKHYRIVPNPSFIQPVGIVYKAM